MAGDTGERTCAKERMRVSVVGTLLMGDVPEGAMTTESSDCQSKVMAAVTSTEGWPVRATGRANE